MPVKKQRRVSLIAMTKISQKNLPEFRPAIPKRAGDKEVFPSGCLTYLAPLPLPTEAIAFCPYISQMNDRCLDFGGEEPSVFSYQVILGGPFGCSCLIAFFFPVLIGIYAALLGYSALDIWDAVSGFYFAAWVPAIGMWLFASAVCFAVWLYHHNLFTKVIPTRFNRQRREACFVPEGSDEPIFVPWESLYAWVVQAQGASQYGVIRQCGMGFGFEHEGEWVRVEFECAGIAAALAHWEAIRGYMEYEINDLKDVQDPVDLQGPDDPPHEGVHTFRNARARLHQRIRDKEVGWVHGFFWYLYHVMTLWTLPNHLVEWEIKRIAKVGRRALPAVMREWSEPLPPDQWAKPSAELLRLSANGKALKKRCPRLSITDVFAQVYAREKTEAGKRKTFKT